MKWISKSENNLIESDSFRLNENVTKKTLFLVEFFEILKFRLFKFIEFNQESAYLLFEKKTGLKHEYIEVVISDNLRVLEGIQTSKQSILETTYPLKTSFILTDNYSIAQQIPKDVFTLDSFVSKYLDYNRYLENLRIIDYNLGDEKFVELSGELLSYITDKQEFKIVSTSDINLILEEFLNSERGNLFVLSKPGGGKSFICRSILKKISSNHNDSKYSIYFDVSLMTLGEKIEDFIIRNTSNYFDLQANEIFDVIYFLNNYGRLILIFDGLDEVFDKFDIKDFISVFGEISKLFTHKSKIIITSRLSFLMSSKHISELLNKEALISDKIATELNSVGLDPLQLPNFEILKLNDIQLKEIEVSKKHLKLSREIPKTNDISITPLEYRLLENIPINQSLTSFSFKNNKFSKSKLIYNYLITLADDLVKSNSKTFQDFVNYFSQSYQKNVLHFELLQLFTFFGQDLFIDNIPSLKNMAFRELFVEFGENKIKFKHKNYLEFMFALAYVNNPVLIDDCISISDEIRIYINEMNNDRSYFNIFNKYHPSELLVDKGYYVTGEYDNTKIRKLDKNLIFDEYFVTVKEYNEFLSAVKKFDIKEFEHSLQPTGFSHTPQYTRLKEKDYFFDEKFLDYPAICLSYWSAYAYASFMGKRLPTSFEWECATRGKYGNLFSWGNSVEISAANSADYWADELLVVYDKWKDHFDKSGNVRGGNPVGKDTFEKNKSDFGIRHMCGNIWEYSSTVSEDYSKVVICGGSFDNPLRAIKGSSKGIAKILTFSNAVGFRCCKELH
ncbi:SUMF1/EgtB/PvdO family nonheme iron enzyme [Maribacter algarum]|uniref:SUMF1/EgtB/PvdO family nonheme iron enzyme n=1 Tax=Maribacter algarum (ex Zhang et al. 2020) TaxID=2578118 RepID=UPI0014860F9C|nr:SUMF1/EgtB/PvdO family nonheme iron enzyme [Maribacter algarum]